MLACPEGLTDADVAAAVQAGWGIAASSTTYAAVGAGSHHWHVKDRLQRRWFVTVDELDATRHEPQESRSELFDRLTAALATAHALVRTGADFVVAPIVGRSGRVVERLGDEWAIAVYPMVDGETFRGGQPLSLADRLAVIEMIARLHGAPMPSRMQARSDDYRLRNRADLEAALTDAHGHRDVGRSSRPVAALLARYRPMIDDMLAEYDDLVTVARAGDDRAVLTHGEPHAGNTLRTPTGWMLVDWDTALLAAPERDVWLLEPGDGVACAAYTAATGLDVRPELLTLFRLRWDLTDLGVDLARLRAPQTTEADAARSSDGIAEILSRRRTGDVVPAAAWR